MSVSPKLSNSTPDAAKHPRWSARHERSRHAPEVIRRLTRDYAYQLKFVVETPADLDEIERYLEEFPRVERGRVLLMPEGIDPTALAERTTWLEPQAAARGFRFCPRKHIEWFGAVRGT
jgi:7-carboxy-7-deazaguanine synthase